jgi:cell division protein FtsW (lipid II flippase)
VNQPADPFVRISHQIQTRLFTLAAVFMLIYSVLLTISPAVRLQNWAEPLLWQHWIGFFVWFVGFWSLHRQLPRVVPDVDPYLFPVMAFLTGWGVLTIWRLDPAYGLRQTIWLALGLILLYYGLRLPGILNLLRRYKYLWLTSGLLLTALTFFLGTYPGGVGPRLWLGCCGVYLQPSEPLKLLLIIYLAAFLADHIPMAFGLLNLISPTFVLTGAALALLLIQRDLGTATLFILIYTITLYLASGKKRMILLTLSAFAIAGVAGYRFVDVVRVRVDAWLNPWADPSGKSYQIIQSLMAVASGGVIGRGPGLGNPGVVPVAHSDFIFAAISEETGMIGVFALIMIFILLIGRSLRVSLYSPHIYHRYLAAGVSAYFAAQTVVIMGGNLRLLPLTGVTLPFMSYGGSSLLTAMAGMLILMNISRQSEEEPAPLSSATPFITVGTAILAAFFVIAVGAGWWGMIRQDNLLTRTDNPRRSISDRYVLRGSIVDRKNMPIDTSVGKPDSYQRVYIYPALSATTGYTDASYGQAGLEASQDEYLRGLKGIPSSIIWWNHILYGQPPAGVDIRLSIDLDLQAVADANLSGHKGAVVLLNASTGEILVLASHPNFDPNQLSENWASLSQSSDAPFLNRATQGQFPPGPALGPFILAATLSNGALPDLPSTLKIISGSDHMLTCVQTPRDSTSWGSVISSGCPAPLVLLSKRFTPIRLNELFRGLGFYDPIDISLPTAPVTNKMAEEVEKAAIGQENLLVSPLQMALAASTLSSGGSTPSPLLAMAIRTPNQGWVILPHGDSKPVFTQTSAATTASYLAEPGSLFWQTLASADSNKEKVTWFIGGTRTQWQGSPLAVAVLLEEDNPELAQTIGHNLFEKALNMK